jgi:hypothetical protein
MPMPYAHGGLCPMPARAPHVTEKGYNIYNGIIPQLLKVLSILPLIIVSPSLLKVRQVTEF